MYIVMGSYNLCLGYILSFSPPVQDGFTPLYGACQGGHKLIVDILLKNGANVNLTLTVSVLVAICGCISSLLYLGHSLSPLLLIYTV